MKFEIVDVELPTRVRLQCVQVGKSSGQPLVVLHGYADSLYSFEQVLPYLSESIHAFALTQRGHGDASRPEDGYAVGNFAADLATFMDVLHLEAAVIAGGSSGGFVARRFAIDYPHRTLGLVLMGTPFTLTNKPNVWEIRDSIVSRFIDPIDPGFVREFLESTLAQPIPEEFMEKLVLENMKVPARVWKATFRGLLADDSGNELDKVKAPTLIIWGGKDSFVPRGDAEALRTRIPNSRLLVYPDAGHAPYLEEPAHVASDIVTFMEGLLH